MVYYTRLFVMSHDRLVNLKNMHFFRSFFYHNISKTAVSVHRCKRDVQPHNSDEASWSFILRAVCALSPKHTSELLNLIEWVVSSESRKKGICIAVPEYDASDEILYLTCQFWFWTNFMTLSNFSHMAHNMRVGCKATFTRYANSITIQRKRKCACTFTVAKKGAFICPTTTT